MVELKIEKSGVPTPNKIVLGNRWENNDEIIHFDLPSTFDNYHKYVIAVMKQSDGNKTVLLPIKNNMIYVSTALTCFSGKWNMYVMCRQKALDLNNANVDIGAQIEEHVFISDVFIGIVNKNMIEKESIENITIDTNIQIVYDDLIDLKNSIPELISNEVGDLDDRLTTVENISATAVQNVSVADNAGLDCDRVENDVVIGIDQELTFILDCGSSIDN